MRWLGLSGCCFLLEVMGALEVDVWDMDIWVGDECTESDDTILFFLDFAGCWDC